MLHDFIVAHRDLIIERAQLRLKERERPLASSSEARLEHGVPLFLSQLADALLPGPTHEIHLVSPADSARDSAKQRIGDSAALHGTELLKNGFSIAQVVHGYGDVCQVVTDLASEAGAPIDPNDFHVFNRCLDDAIAGAVTAYASQRERDLSYEGTERLGVLAHELRNLLNTAILSFDVMKRGMVGLGGSTGAIHSRSLAGLRALVERSLAEVRLRAGVPQLEHISVAEFVEEVVLSAAMQAEASGLKLEVDSVDGSVWIEGDRQLLMSAVSNLLQNAFKFTRAQGTICFSARASGKRVLLSVADECGGLPLGKLEELFEPFKRGDVPRSGLGLGLSIALRATRTNSGDLYVRDVPGTGCVFTIDLPRHPPPGGSRFQVLPDGKHELPETSPHVALGGAHSRHAKARPR